MFTPPPPRAYDTQENIRTLQIHESTSTKLDRKAASPDVPATQITCERRSNTNGWAAQALLVQFSDGGGVGAAVPRGDRYHT